MGIRGCPENSKTICVHHGWLDNHCYCKPGFHANASLVERYKQGEDVNWEEACISNKLHQCYSITDMDTHTWCNYGINGCTLNNTECIHYGWFVIKCMCKPGFHVDLAYQY